MTLAASTRIFRCSSVEPESLKKTTAAQSTTSYSSLILAPEFRAVCEYVIIDFTHVSRIATVTYGRKGFAVFDVR